ncbi:MAG: polymer-forming cytoskeletal protein [Gemmatimonadota bacterium]
MRGLVSRPGALVALLLSLPLWAVPAMAQEPTVVSSQVAVSSAEARLELELADGDAVEIALADGEVRIGGDVVASFRSGDDLDRAWRTLLSRAIALSGVELSEALVEWAPPAGLDGDALDAARRIDRALEEAAAPSVAVAPTAPAAGIEVDGLRGLLGLLRHADRLAELGPALEGVDVEDLQLYIGEDGRIAEGEVVDRSVLIVDGNLNVDGRVTGDVIVVGGRLRVSDSGEIEGDVRLLDARLSDDGEIGGDVTRLRADPERRVELPDLDSLRDEIRSEVEREMGRSMRDDVRRSVRSPFRNVAAGIGGILENLLTFGVLCAIGAVLLHFAGPRMEAVAETARLYPARSAAVGLAGAFLLVPAWVLGIVALVISIVGIPLAIAWIPLFPLAAGLAALAGALAVAINVGEWIRTHDVRGFEWAREPGTLYRMAAGLAAATLVFVAANTLQMAGSLLGFLHGLLSAVGTLAILAMATVGFGAVLLTRGGSRPDLVGESFTFDDWKSGWRSERWGRGTAGMDEPTPDTYASEPTTDAPPPTGPAVDEVELAFDDVETDVPSPSPEDEDARDDDRRGPGAEG